MVFSGLLSAGDRARGRSKSGSSWTRSDSPRSDATPTPVPVADSSASDSIASDYISDPCQLQPLNDEAPDLCELNSCLDALALVFPDIQIEVFREMLSSFDGESRMHVVADALLKNRLSWVKGRWRVVEGDRKDASEVVDQARASNDTGRARVSQKEAFRSTEYKKAVKTLAWYEFKGLPRSTINAVLAESNYSYLAARRTLVDLSSKSWRFTISSLFLRRKPVTCPDSEHHPLVVWRSTGHGSIVPSIKSTGNAELDRELFEDLVVPLQQQARRNQEEKDHTLAMLLNTEEAESLDCTYDCACCFTSSPFEEFTTCSTDGHMICFRCVQHTTTEAVFGQGWHRTIDTKRGTLRCPAVDSGECSGCIPACHLHRAMLEEKNGAEILHRLESRLAEHSLLSSGLPLVRCPFCDYAEIDEVYLPPGQAQLKIRADSLCSLAFIVFCVGVTPLFLPFIFMSSFVCLVLCSKASLGNYVFAQLKASVSRHRRRRRGLKFSCQNPRCRGVSCLSCSKRWVDVHVCHESSLVALRTQVEQAMSLAIKRVCPRCNTSFVKNSGCNKLTCPCGYKMCYVCRKDIGAADEGYRHFCEHFRPEGDPRQCGECTKCNLWENEDTDLVLREAQDEVERKWRETEKRDLSGAERAFLETGIAANGGERSVQKVMFSGKWPTVSEVCDMVVENVFA